MSKIVKLRWGRKLAQAKYFVILTDTESVIALDGVDPKSFKDVMALQAQSAAIEDFTDRLKDLKKQHDKAIDRLQGGKRATTSRKKVTRIKVKKG